MSDPNLLFERPKPSREFEDRLRRHLRNLDARAGRPPHLWAMIVAYAVAGIALLLVAVAGVGI